MNLVGSSIFYEYRIHCVYIVKNKIIIPIFQGMKIGGADKRESREYPKVCVNLQTDVR